MKKYLLLVPLILIQVMVCGQKYKTDSLAALLATERTDSNKVILLWNMAISSNNYDPFASLNYGRQALNLARTIQYKEGELRSLGNLANTYLNMGNYPLALEYNLKKLVIVEDGKNPFNLSSVIMNIGIIYVMQEEYRKALHYFFRADSVIQTNQVEELKYNIAVNLGDVYYRLNIYDTALIFFKKSLAIAEKNNDSNSIGTTFVGLGQVYFKQGDDSLSRMSLLNALAYLQSSNNEILICEAALSLAKVYQKIKFKDSAEYYARLTSGLAKKDGFLSWELDAAIFMSDHYKAFNKDSAFTYLERAQFLRDSLNSKYRILQSQKLVTDEQFRQAKLAEDTIRQKEERSKQLQFLFIGIFIPGLLLFTVFLSRRKVHIRLIKLLGILSLLILFEYLTLLLHPRVLELTNHKPVYEIMVFVAIAALLIPSHHRLEHWLIQRLTKRKDRYNEMHANIQSKEKD